LNSDTYSSGNADISPIIGAFAIATKGHFYDISPTIKVPWIFQNDTRERIYPLEKEDETWVGVEKFSGINLQSRFRNQINLVANSSSSLFNNLDHDFIFPLYFNQRDTMMTDS